MTRLPNATDSTPAADAARAAFEQYRAELHRFLVQRLHNAQDAQDLAQETYMRFLQVSQHEVVRQPQAFLYRLASNLVYEFRLRARRSFVQFDSEAADKVGEHSADVWSDELNDRLSATRQLEGVLKQLPKSYQTVLLLRKRDGLSPEEIAERLGLSKATVYTYLIRAVAQFKARFKQVNVHE